MRRTLSLSTKNCSMSQWLHQNENYNLFFSTLEAYFLWKAFLRLLSFLLEMHSIIHTLTHSLPVYQGFFFFLLRAYKFHITSKHVKNATVAFAVCVFSYRVKVRYSLPQTICAMHDETIRENWKTTTTYETNQPKLQAFKKFTQKNSAQKNTGLCDSSSFPW